MVGRLVSFGMAQPGRCELFVSGSEILRLAGIWCFNFLDVLQNPWTQQDESTKIQPPHMRQNFGRLKTFAFFGGEMARQESFLARCWMKVYHVDVLHRVDSWLHRDSSTDTYAGFKKNLPRQNPYRVIPTYVVRFFLKGRCVPLSVWDMFY